MNSLREDCPNQSVRQAFANGELSDAMAESVSEHVAHCKLCSEEIDQWFVPPGNGSSMFSELDAQEDVEHLVDSVTCNDRRSALDVGRGSSSSRELAGHSMYVGRYRILETIGRGSFGVVRVGVHPVLQKKVAVKVSHVAFQSSLRKSQFLREAETAAQLDHPNIVQVIDADELPDQRCYIVFQYVNGKNLKELVESRQLHVGQALSIFRCILAGVQHAHKRGIVHRDLKLSNIMVDADMQPRITDFGLALMMNNQPVVAGQGGTRGYMAPEQENGEIRRIDARTDIYSLGILLAKMTAGEPLSQGNWTDSSQDFQALLQTAGVPSNLLKICLKCCMQRPKDRYQTIDELKEDIDHLPSRRNKNLERPAKLASIGLQPFLAEHASVYREWLTIGRFGRELNKAIRSWRSRIERFGFEPSFEIGLISGKTGSGKSSLINAGILPSLSEEVVVKKFDCKQDSSAVIEDFLMHCVVDSAEADHRTKTLIVLDHFKVEHFENVEVLYRALRRIDGVNLQCILVANNDELANTLELFDELEIALDPMENFFRMPILDGKSAQGFLLQWGALNNCVPDHGVKAQASIEQIVNKMDSEDELNLPTLHLFIHNFRALKWDHLFILEMEKVEHWRFKFADSELLCHRHRLLLPVLTYMVEHEGEIDFRRMETDLADSRVTTELLPLLNSSKTKLLSPCPGQNENNPKLRQQISQDYLRPIIVAFVNQIQQFGTGHSRRWYELHRGANRWETTGLRSDLLPIHHAIATSLRSFNWKLSPTEKRYLRGSMIRAFTNLGHIAILTSLLAIVFLSYRQIQNNQTVYDVLAKTERATNSVSNGWYNQLATNQLLYVANDRNDTISRRTSAVSGLLNNRSFPAEVFVDLIEQSNLAEQDYLFLIAAKKDDPSALIAALENANAAGPKRDFETILLALHLLNVGQKKRIEDLVTRISSFGDYLKLVRLIEGRVPIKWVAVMAARSDISNDLRMLLLDSLDEEKVKLRKNDLAFCNLLLQAIRFARTSKHQRLISCSLRIVDQMGLAFDQVLPEWSERNSSVGFVNSVGVPMLRLNLELQDLSKSSLYVSAMEVEYRQVRHFLAADSDVPHSISAREYFQVDRLPATSVTAQSAMEYCNYLSRMEGRTPYYKRAERVVKVDGKKGARFNRSKYVANAGVDGYRLLRSEEWLGLINCSVGWEAESVAAEDVDLFANCNYINREIRPFGQSRPMESGFYDAFGNSDELCDKSGDAQEFVYRGGMFLNSLEQGLEVRSLESPNDRAWFVGFRICCPEAAN